MAAGIALLGSTGSIGRQAIEVIKRYGYTVSVLSCHSNIDLLERQFLEVDPQAQRLGLPPPILAVEDDAAGEKLRRRMAGAERSPTMLVGLDAARNAVAEANSGLVLNAVVGIAGLSATLTALASGTDVALANKESLVTGGALVMGEAEARGAVVIPVDSEHSAIFQCLNGRDAPHMLWLTGSGGPFYGKTTAELRHITKQQALKHPNWEMGPKITIDSATLMNKGLEFIEAMWLFDVPPEKIEIVIQRESVIHSMVEFADGAVLAQLGAPDMRVPIQYAITWPDSRRECDAPRLNFKALSALHFGVPDVETFRCLAACRTAAEKGGLAPCAANGANEEAVGMFLREEIGFLDIGRLVEGCVHHDSYAGSYDLEDVYACDAAARRYVREHAGH